MYRLRCPRNTCWSTVCIRRGETRHWQSSWVMWQSYCIGKMNVIYERYKFNNRSQEPDESIDTYATALWTLAETCEFGHLKDDLIRDRLVCGIRDNGARKIFLQEPKITLDKCLDTCRAAEATKVQIQAMSSQSSMKDPTASEVNFVNPTHGKYNFTHDCKFCGKSHERKKEMCLAYGRVCNKCKKKKNLAVKCQSKGEKSGFKKSGFEKKVHTLDPSTSSEEELLTVTLSSEDVNTTGTTDTNSASDSPYLKQDLCSHGDRWKDGANASWLGSIV